MTAQKIINSEVIIKKEGFGTNYYIPWEYIYSLKDSNGNLPDKLQVAFCDIEIEIDIPVPPSLDANESSATYQNEKIKLEDFKLMTGNYGQQWLEFYVYLADKKETRKVEIEITEDMKLKASDSLLKLFIP